MQIEELVYGTKGNETYLTIVLKTITPEKSKQLVNRPAIYKIFDKSGELVYVGETKNLKKRITNHLSTTHSKKEIYFDTVGYIEYAYVDLDRYERAVVEGILVTRYNPKYNCDDIQASKSRLKLSLDQIRDVQFYLRNTDLSVSMIAKAFGFSRTSVRSIKDYGVGNTLEIPKSYTPSVIIDDEFIRNYKATRTTITQELFNKVRKLMDEGKRNIDIEEILGIASSTASQIRHLRCGQYQEWEQERVKEVA